MSQFSLLPFLWQRNRLLRSGKQIIPFSKGQTLQRFRETSVVLEAPNTHVLSRVLTSQSFLSSVPISCRNSGTRKVDYHSPRKSSKGKSGFSASCSEEKKMTPVLAPTWLGKGKAGTSHTPAVKYLGLLASKIMPAPKDASGTALTREDLKWNYCQAFSKSNQLWNKLGGKII